MSQCLSLLEFLVKSGAERCIEEIRDHMRVIRALQEYNFYEGTADKGGGVREKAKQLVDLLSSNETIRDEREKARRLRDKFVGISNTGGGGYPGMGRDSYSSGGGGSSGYGRDSSGYGNRDQGDSYSGSGSAGSGGGRYNDSSSGGSGGRYNSRYGNDSHSGGSGSGRDAYDSGSYSSGGIDSGRTSSKPSPARYGGGSYDTDHRARYTDEAADPLDSHSAPSFGKNKSTASRELDDNDRFVSSNDVGVADEPKSKGKIKISINSGGTARTNKAPVSAAAEVDLFADPTGPVVQHAPAPVAAFDAFGGRTYFYLYIFYNLFCFVFQPITETVLLLAHTVEIFSMHLPQQSMLHRTVLISLAE